MAERTLALTVVVAVKDDASNLPAILERLDLARHNDVEFIFCLAGVSPGALQSSLAAVQVIIADPSSLVPHLWRDGIGAANGTRVALTTATCVPAHDWVERAKTADVARWPGIGGAIACDPTASPADHAVFFLRYSGFLPGGVARDVDEIAADNAVYARQAVIEHPDLLAQGFWEPSFHQRFREAGLKLQFDPALLVTHRGGGSPQAFAAHRFLHGRQYGRDRTKSGSTSRAGVLLVASALVPLIMLTRTTARVSRRPNYLARLLKSLPWLIWFILAWSAGEATGYWDTVAVRLGRNRGNR